MTKDDLEFVRDNHELNKKSYDDHATCGYNYEDGYVDALSFVLEHLDELCEGIRQEKQAQYEKEQAKYFIRKYFENRSKYYGLSSDEIEDRIQSAFENGDDEMIANYFIESANEGCIDDGWRESITRDFYN